MKHIGLLCLVVLAGMGCSADPLGGTKDGGGDLPIVIQCPGTFPSFDRTCTAVTDCDVGLHQTDCCGSELAIGLAKKVRADFNAAEMVCRSQYPGCGCAAMPTRAEDGKTAMEGHPIVVDCVAGQCRTSVP